jgi:hypothetical protein
MSNVKIIPSSCLKQITVSMPVLFLGPPGPTSLENNLVVVIFHKQGLYMHALRSRPARPDYIGTGGSGPGT